eukprot:CAMPEP_0119572686 /NCGR_PEP_ID=MMETSP1352-20130426/44747_1 /TAXON_ID=265584 /ORGANISM="Stauroneis constricta, Strain CCMP1120" /LENGTH=230 /DNA_ID=CAMNT_0007622373 /DNA_START=20 /DNA_END=712 /DNA_ORIENTATION=-
MTVDLSTIQVAVIGGGSVGTSLATQIHNSKKVASVVIAARDPSKTRSQLDEKGMQYLKVVAVPDALKDAKVIILATPGIYDDAGIQAFVESTPLVGLKDKIVIDATNPLGPFAEGLNTRVMSGNGTSGAEQYQKCLPYCKVYKAFNTVGAEHMQQSLGKDMMFAGDPEEESLAIAEGVVAATGFKPFYVGPIRYARNLEAIAELYIHMAVPPLGARTTSRNFWFSISGDP